MPHPFCFSPSWSRPQDQPLLNDYRQAIQVRCQPASKSDRPGWSLFHRAQWHTLGLDREPRVYFDQCLLHFGMSYRLWSSNSAHCPVWKMSKLQLSSVSFPVLLSFQNRAVWWDKGTSCACKIPFPFALVASCTLWGRQGTHRNPWATDAYPCTVWSCASVCRSQ